MVGQFTSKKRLFQELGEIASQAYGLSGAAAIDGLQERETLGPTGVGHGIALPHARLEDLKGIIGVFVRLEKPLDYDSVDRQPVDLVFGLFANKAPRPILYAGLTIYILIWVADAIADPSRLMNGIIFKAIIIGTMVNAIRTMRVNDAARG